MCERLFAAMDVQLAAGSEVAGGAFASLGGGRWVLDIGRAPFEELLGVQLRSFTYDQAHHTADLRVACS